MRSINTVQVIKQNVLFRVFYFLLTTNLRGKYSCYPYIKVEETETQKISICQD